MLPDVDIILCVAFPVTEFSDILNAFDVLMFAMSIAAIIATPIAIPSIDSPNCSLCLRMYLKLDL